MVIIPGPNYIGIIGYYGMSLCGILELSIIADSTLRAILFRRSRYPGSVSGVKRQVQLDREIANYGFQSRIQYYVANLDNGNLSLLDFYVLKHSIYYLNFMSEK